MAHPGLTGTSKLRHSYQKVRKYFARIVKLLATSKTPGDKFWREAKLALRFAENNVEGLCIGYSKSDTSGSGIGDKLREHLLTTAKEIIDAGIRDPEIFELVGLLEEGIGADRISDMVANVILDDLLEYAQHVFRKVGIPKDKLMAIPFKGKVYELPINPFNWKPIILVPKDVLRDLPIAHSWDDIDRVVAVKRSPTQRGLTEARFQICSLSMPSGSPRRVSCRSVRCSPFRKKLRPPRQLRPGNGGGRPLGV